MQERHSEATGSELGQKEVHPLAHLSPRLLTTAGEEQPDSHQILFRLTDLRLYGAQDSEPSTAL